MSDGTKNSLQTKMFWLVSTDNEDVPIGEYM